jgi:hypothetical protein
MKELAKVDRMFFENVVAINHLSYKSFYTLKVSQLPGFFQPEPPVSARQLYFFLLRKS